MLLRDILSHAVKIYPDKVGIIDGDTRYTYRQAVERVYKSETNYYYLDYVGGSTDHGFVGDYMGGALAGQYIDQDRKTVAESSWSNLSTDWAYKDFAWWGDGNRVAKDYYTSGSTEYWYDARIWPPNSGTVTPSIHGLLS